MSGGSSANISGRARRRLNRLCDKYNLSQPEVLDILLDLHERAERLGMIHFTPAVLEMKPLDGEPEMPKKTPRHRGRQGGHSSKPHSKRKETDSADAASGSVSAVGEHREREEQETETA